MLFPESSEGKGDVIMESTNTETAALCCEKCIQHQHCLWSIYEASGSLHPTCYLVLLNNDTNANTEGKKKGETAENKDTAEEKQAGSCSTQQQKGAFGYSAGNGEVRYVVSNGLCGLLIEA